MNAVHPYHDASRYKTLRHFILAFHDSTFECVSEAYEIAVLNHCTLHDAIDWMKAKLAK